MSLDKKANQLMAILLPLVEAAGIGYATYVVVYLISIRYLINPPHGLQVRGIEPRTAAGIGLIVGYFVLLLVFGITFLRLLQVIWVNPGVVQMGEKREGESGGREKESRSTKYFDRLDAYICDYQGWPLWCEKCQNWKPDRTHHSSQLGRCVRRMVSRRTT
jgi:palmitoyltransferase